MLIHTIHPFCPRIKIHLIIIYSIIFKNIKVIYILFIKRNGVSKINLNTFQTHVRIFSIAVIFAFMKRPPSGQNNRSKKEVLNFSGGNFGN